MILFRSSKISCNTSTSEIMSNFKPQQFHFEQLNGNVESNKFRIREVEWVFENISFHSELECWDPGPPPWQLSGQCQWPRSFLSGSGCISHYPCLVICTRKKCNRISTLATFLCLDQLLHTLSSLKSCFMPPLIMQRKYSAFPLFLINMFPDNFLFNRSHPKRVGILFLLFLYSYCWE